VENGNPFDPVEYEKATTPQKAKRKSPKSMKKQRKSARTPKKTLGYAALFTTNTYQKSLLRLLLRAKKKK
jgi:hypothetical protein